jgi:hypothetical protein
MKKPSDEIVAILGKRILRIKGFRHVYSAQVAYASYILLEDKETIIELSEQGPEYHDCSIGARNIRVYKDKRQWAAILENDNLPDATELT